jgi:hypothetical protein
LRKQTAIIFSTGPKKEYQFDNGAAGRTVSERFLITLGSNSLIGTYEGLHVYKACMRHPASSLRKFIRNSRHLHQEASGERQLAIPVHVFIPWEAIFCTVISDKRRSSGGQKYRQIGIDVFLHTHGDGF